MSERCSKGSFNRHDVESCFCVPIKWTIYTKWQQFEPPCTWECVWFLLREQVLTMNTIMWRSWMPFSSRSIKWNVLSKKNTLQKSCWHGPEIVLSLQYDFSLWWHNLIIQTSPKHNNNRIVCKFGFFKFEDHKFNMPYLVMQH